MKIHWSQNPLQTVVELDERDMEILRFKVALEEMEERIYGAHFYLEGAHLNIERAIRELDVENLEDVPFAKAIDQKLGWLVPSLSDAHVGDCTCVPCSCTKCHAESMLGINTIKGLGQHSAYKVDNACKASATLSEAIVKLQEYEAFRDGAWLTRPEEEFARYIPRWKNEAAWAAKWLQEYQREHFSAVERKETKE